MKKRLEHMKETLAACVESQLNHLDTVDTKELGEAIDMIKDLEEAIYYCTITKAMNQKEEEGWDRYPMTHYRDMDKDMGRMYYEAPEHDRHPLSEKHHDPTKLEHEAMRDSREGRSPHSRKMYMELKEKHSDKATQMHELENYMQELTQDVVEMVEDATAEERQYLSKRVAALANKLAQLND